MSRTVLASILSAMFVRLTTPETEELYSEILARFNLIGASNHCQARESAWSDPQTRAQIAEFVEAWLRRKRKKKAQPIAGLV